MNRIIMVIILVISLSLTSCRTFSSTLNTIFPEVTRRSIIINDTADFNSIKYMNWLNTMPDDGYPIIFAYTSRLGDRHKEKAHCLLNAAAQASRFLKVSAVSKFYSKQVSGSILYSQDLEIGWDRSIEVDLLDDLKVIKTLQDHNGTYMIVRLESARITPTLSYIPELFKTDPSWILNPPKIPGYIVGAGTVLQTGYMSNSFEAADNQALEEIIRQIAVSSQDMNRNLESNSTTISINDNIETAEAEITGFYVIQRWYSPDKRYFHSLAIAPENNR